MSYHLVIHLPSCLRLLWAMGVAAGKTPLFPLADDSPLVFYLK